MPADPYVELQHSAYLDLTSFQGKAPLPSGTPLASSFTINVALVLERANDPAKLLNADWGTRQKELAALNKNDSLWTTYGADKDDYQKVLDKLDELGIPTFYDKNAPPNGQYVSSAESRTIWVQLDETSFTTLFGPGAALQDGGENGVGQDVVFWNGNLSLPRTMVDAGVKGLWFDTGMLSAPILANPGKGPEATLPAGAQSPGNSVPGSEYPNDVAARYNFPFADPELSAKVQTGRIGLVEPGMGTALPDTATGTLDQLVQIYRNSAGIDEALAHILHVAGGGQHFTAGDASHDERALDVGIATTVNPRSQIILYAGSGHQNGAGSDPFTAYQSAIWDTVHKPEALSSSFSSYQHIAPGSPFHFAQEQLFIDAALRGITVVNAAGDGGSGSEYPNGLTNVEITHASAYTLVAGGASFSTVGAAGQDGTLSKIFNKAMDGNRGVIWQLVSGGLKVLPSRADDGETLVETVWNAYHVFFDHGPKHNNVIADKTGKGGGYFNNESGAGGVDITRPTPSYQIDFGLNPVTSDPRAATGRGIPDIAATSGGNMGYKVPWPDFEVNNGSETTGTGGTSAAAPLWASLALQINAIFADQKLPRLGYMNDLLYTAAAIAPAAFNDVTIGQNTSSSVLGGPFYTAPKGEKDPTIAITPTGYGYSAEPGYDLATGLGTPNGVLLARAMTWIAHMQMSEDGAASVLTAGDKSGWKSPVKQKLLVQVTSTADADVKVLKGNGTIKFDSAKSDKFAWTSQFAQQALQPDFDPALVKLFDRQSQGALVQTGIKAGAGLAIKIDMLKAGTPQGKLSADYGFVDYVSDGSAVRVASPVAVAETVGGLDDQVAVVRVRQGGKGDFALKLYRVDDFKGTIDGIRPGDDGYNAAVRDRTYDPFAGKGRLNGPGYGDYAEKRFVGIDDGDIVAMKFRSGDHVYWAFARGNEKHKGEHVSHLWNYGVNTWGWESGYKGGDRDYNDLVVQIDFTSAYGHGWLM